MAGQVTTTVFSALTVMIVARLLRAENYGVVAVVMVPINLAYLVQDLGLNTALTRYGALMRGEGRYGDLKTIIWTGLAMKAAISGIATLLLFATSGYVASWYLERPELVELVRIATLYIFGESLLTGVQSVLVSLGRMEAKSVTQVAWTIIRGIISISLVILGFGPYGHLLANSVAPLTVAILGLILYLSTRGSGDRSTLSPFGAARMILGFGLPIYMSSLVSGGLTQLQGTLLIRFVEVSIVGNYYAAVNFGTLIGFFTVPLGTVLFPVFSKIPRGSSELGRVFRTSVKYTALITLPVTLAMVAVSTPLVRIIYGVDYIYAAAFLQVYLLLFLFEPLGGISLGNLILGVGESRVAFIANLINFAVCVPLSVTLIPAFGVWGLLVCLLLGPRVSMVYTIWWAKKALGVGLDWRSTLKLYFSSLVAFSISYSVITLTEAKTWLALVVGGGSYALIYLVTVPLIGALTRRDLEDLRIISDSIGPLKIPLEIVLSIVEKLAR